MKLKPILFLMGVLMLITACQTHKVVTESLVPSGLPQPDTTLIPAFSGELLYLFGREYMAMYDTLSDKFDTPEAALIRQQNVSMSDYIEQRLITFFPEVAYTGMVKKWKIIAEQLVQQDEADILLFNNEELGMQQIRKGVLPLGKNDKQEAVFLQLTEEESAVFRQLNTLANAARMAVPNDLPDVTYSLQHPDNESFAPDIHSSFEEENILVSLLLAGGPYAFYRVILSKKRAETKAKEYYAGDTYAGKLGDAFKHTYVNILLTAYLSEEIAKFVMNDVWEQWHINAPCDRYMDLHNNYIGRHARYMELHGTSDDWNVWAQNVYNFIQDTLSNSSYQTWSHETPLFQINYDLRKTPADKYIYWNKELTLPNDSTAQ
ncbi:MAG: hypothetical protein NC038_03275 [Paludibacter sp.]|nr:hypothetical protein [Bacteroidales bacterium]MCM1069108.1 hypothetical protein [Prevotella sp.]MCM1353547.1 hypothetical protein [Bacteroides sp.]MCM1442708.1 hypothetical protein [Muribaculum sp.]MCM1481656.1 hypothetical protein [Paludibacter sp.]